VSIAGSLFVTPHAVRQYQGRVEPLAYNMALATIIKALAEPERISGQGSVRTYHTPGWRALVKLPKRQGTLCPVVLTVLRGSEEAP